MSNRGKKDQSLYRQSAHWFQTEETKNPGFNPLPNYQESHYTRMLIEDVHAGVMPYGTMAKLNAHVEPIDSDTEDLIKDAISRDAYKGQLYKVVADFTHDCAAWMMTYGNAAYEIAYLYATEEKPVAFKLLHIPPSSIKVKDERFIQSIPESVRRELGLPSETIELTPEHVIIFELPTYMRDAYESMMAALFAQGSVVSIPDFVLSSIKGETGPVSFDVNKYTRDQKMAVAEATKQIGWNARQVPNDEFKTEYYDLHRFLLFERFKLEVRNSILSTLNEALARAGNKIGFQGQIVIEGLPILSDIQEAQKSLAEGSKKFGDVIKPFLPFL